MGAPTHREVRLVNGKRVATTEYRSWQMMKNRCLNPKAQDWDYYGGRGVKIADEWVTFEAFLADMGRKPTPQHSLERKDSNGHYCKSNCVWATRQEQARNRDYVKLSMVDARAIRYLWKARRPGINRQKDIAEVYGVSQRTICQIVRGETWKEGEDA